MKGSSANHFPFGNNFKKMGFSKLSPIAIFLSFLVFSLFLTPSFAAKKSYVVLMGSHSHGLNVSEANLQRVAHSHYKLLGSFLGSNKKAKDAIFYSYKKHINGFAAVLEEEEAANLAKHPEVAVVLGDEMMELHTTHSWSFMHLENNGTIPSSAWRKARFGEDTIIATLDSGVWPESMSFRDDGITGPIPSTWKGSCESADNGGVHCNRKLIGAKFFNEGYIAYMRSMNPYFDVSQVENTARDYAGHGSHTLSTAGGNFVAAKYVFGSTGFGSAKGGSPRARLAAYKVCWGSHVGCPGSDIIRGLDEAIHDGVHVVSYSIGGGPSPYYQDGFAIAAFHAVKKGISVVCSAGNAGRPGSAVNLAPWLLTVAASTLDRRIQALVRLNNGQTFEGKSLSSGLAEEKYYPLISGAQATAVGAYTGDAMLCKSGALDPEKVKGKILACLRGETARIDKGTQAAKAGAVGMILCNDQFNGEQTSADFHVLPAAHIGYRDGLAVFNYIYTTRNPTAYLVPPTEKFDLKPAPIMADFSSKGPNVITPEIIKPDITAPGVDIIAATTQAHGPSGDPSDNRKIPYVRMSGTSMSCPHISGIAGLLKTLHPDWSPAAIKSAIMTTAKVQDNTMHTMQDEVTSQPATPFSYGSGHVQPVEAMDPGLVYDLTTEDYLEFLCAQGYDQRMMRPFLDGPYECPRSASILNFNYPSIAVQNLNGRVTVTRKLKNVGAPGVYKATVRQPEGISVTVEPSVLRFEKVGEEKSFSVTLSGVSPQYAVVDGTLVWSDSKHSVRSPIVVSSGYFF